MAHRIVLHSGAMKTGTSFVQSALKADPAALAHGGVEFLENFGVQTRATLDLLRFGSADPSKRPHRWSELARAARESDAETVLVSMEFLSFARGAPVERALAELAGLDVRVLLTVRDQTRVLPAQWQTLVRNMGTDSWADYLRAIRRKRRTRAWRTFHRAQDVPEILDEWCTRTAVTVVTVPPPGAAPDVLWTRFCEAAGIAVPEIDLGALRANPSLGYASCDYLRGLNEHLPDVAPKKYRLAVRPLVRAALVGLRSDEQRPALDRTAAEFALDLNRQARDAVAAHGCPLVGTVDDLPVDADLGAFPGRVEAPDPAQVLRAAHAGWAYAARLDGGAVPPDGPPTDLAATLRDTARRLTSSHDWA